MYQSAGIVRCVDFLYQTINSGRVSDTGHIEQRRTVPHHNTRLYELLPCQNQQPLRRGRDKVSAIHLHLRSSNARGTGITLMPP